MNYSPPLTKSETIRGFAWLAFQIVFLPDLVAILTYFIPMDLLQANLVYYLVNLIAVAVIFRRFLLQNFDLALESPGNVCFSALFGMGRYWIMSALVGMIVISLEPNFINYNDEALLEMADLDLPLLAFATIVLVPPAEETLFRGLIFRNLFDKNKAAAYLVSTVAFAAIHLVNFLGDYSLTTLLLAFLQYVPAGLCLGWAYEHSGTIFAPIFIHCLVNAIGIAAMR